MMVMMIVPLIVLVIDLAAATFSLSFSAQDRSRRQQAKPAGGRALDEVATRDAAALEISNPVFDLFHLSWPCERNRSRHKLKFVLLLSLLLVHARGQAM